MTTHRFPDAPAAMLALRTDHRGFPVPWFVGDVDGKPDFRMIGPRKVHLAVTKSLCWLCGRKLGRLKTFVIGPMCAVNRISAEPPSHLECATFAARACPFLSNPLAKRVERGLPEDRTHPGIMIPRNPGVTLVWSSLRYKTVSDGAGGTLFDIGSPERIAWFAEGRAATRSEVLASMETGLPILIEAAEQEGINATAALVAATVKALRLVPAA